MTKFRCQNFIACLLFGLLLLGCGKSDDQKEFEDQAFSTPSGYTETIDANHEPDKVDPDDWRISPMYQGIVSFNVIPWPNPVTFNGQLNFDLGILPQGVSNIDIYVFSESSQNLLGPIDNISSTELQGGNVNIRLAASNFSNTGSSGLFRILILDGQEDVISYGDVQVN